MASWLVVEWENGVGISYEPQSKLKLLEGESKWHMGARVKQFHQKKTVRCKNSDNLG